MTAALRQAPLVLGSAFDALASKYDDLWSNTPIGIAQRTAVWNEIATLFRPGESVIDLGCGTGVDALHLMKRGLAVYAIDGSQQMIRVAREHGVDAHCLRIEELSSAEETFDGGLSNFGALNCVPSLEPVSQSLAKLIRRDGFVALCFLNRVCLWEIVFHLLRGQARRALRRLQGHADSSFGARAWYPSHKQIQKAFRASFRLIARRGVGIAVPPSYVNSFSSRQIDRFAFFDRRLGRMPLFRSLGDHCLYIFQRL